MVLGLGLVRGPEYSSGTTGGPCPGLPHGALEGPGTVPSSCLPFAAIPVPPASGDAR